MTNLLGFPILSVLLWLPALGSLLLLAIPSRRLALARWTALSVALATFGVAVGVATLFYTGPYGPLSAGEVVGPPLQFVDRVTWISAFGADYAIGLDGINLWLVVLTAFLSPFAIIATWSKATRQVRALLALLLLLETALLGVFLAQDMLLFYIFWELALLPVVFMIGIWGGHGRAQAATRLFVYTFAGSVLMLLGIIAVYILHRNAMSALTPEYRGTFDLTQIVNDIRAGAFVMEPTVQRLLFGTFFAAFAIKMALWPFHTWLPGAYEAAPAPVAIVLAGLMSKLGTYGFIRFNLTLFPEVSAWAAPAIAVLAVVGIIYAAVVAFSQTDMQRLIAYASISHMNLIVLGIFTLNTTGVSGAIFQMVSHGVNIAALLLLVNVLYERREIRDLASFGGLWRVMPVYAGMMLLTLLATMGLPGLNGFIGEFTIMQGAFSSGALGWPYALGAAVGVVLAAAYGLHLFRSSFMGTVDNLTNEDLPDLSRRERLTLGLLMVPIIAGGLFPNLLLAPLQGTVAGLLQYIG